MGGELRTSVGHNPFGYAMYAHYAGAVQICQLFSRVGSLDGNKMGNLGQPIDNDPNGVMSTGGPWKSGDKIHSDFIPFPLGDLQRLKQSCGSLVFGLDSLTHITFGYIRTNLPLHPMPPKIFTELLIHLRSARVDGVGSIMSFLQD